MTNLDSIFKSRDITLPTKVRLLKAMVFPVIMYGCESWTVKKTERRRIDAFELWCWRRLLGVPWTARRSNKSILKEISPGCSLEGLMLKVKLQYLATWCRELTHWKRSWCWEGLGAGGEGDDRGWDGWMASPIRWTWVWINSGSWWWTGRPGMLWFMGSQRVRHDWATELNWTDLVIENENVLIILCLLWNFDDDYNDVKTGSCYRTWSKCPCGYANQLFTTTINLLAFSIFKPFSVLWESTVSKLHTHNQIVPK